MSKRLCVMIIARGSFWTTSLCTYFYASIIMEVEICGFAVKNNGLERRNKKMIFFFLSRLWRGGRTDLSNRVSHHLPLSNSRPRPRPIFFESWQNLFVRFRETKSSLTISDVIIIISSSIVAVVVDVIIIIIDTRNVSANHQRRHQYHRRRRHWQQHRRRRHWQQHRRRWERVGQRVVPRDK